MKNPTFLKILLLLIFSGFGLQTAAQNLVPFSSANAFDDDLKGDILTIGNTLLGPTATEAHNNQNAGNNSNITMVHVDIDGDSTTFNSSSAELVVPNPNCYVIRHAMLYWGAVEAEDGTTDDEVRQIKFKGPSGNYEDITGNLIYRDDNQSLNSAYPYACYADVTNFVQNQPNSLGYYTVANVQTKTGRGNSANPRNRNGYTAGWSLFVVYEDPTLPSKSITSFNGFSAIFSGQPSVDIDVTGFRTIPTGPVRANLAFATLEGDLSIGGDRMRLNGTVLSSADRPGRNFFRSLVTQLDGQPVNNRIPASSNTLGFDTGVIRVPNPGNGVIDNGDSSATMGLTSSGDFFLQYFFAFAVEIIEPDIVLTKIVENELGEDIGDQIVQLGQELNYVISFQNTGNDDGRNLIIRDVLPINTVFDFPSGLTLPNGVTAVSYDPNTRELVLSVEDYLVEEGDPSVTFRIRGSVVENCSDLVEACSNLIQNQAFASYVGTVNPDFVISDDPSVNSNTGCLLTPQATNFLADLDPCEFRETAVLCGESIDIIAANGYSTYSWSNDPSGTPVLGNSQTLTVTESGTYYVYNVAPAPCRSIVQIFEVITYGENQTNPILTQADEIVSCTDDGTLMPNIFLCGLNDFRDLTAEVTGAVDIIWEQLDEGSCPVVDNINCANEGMCTWDELARGSGYTVSTSGQFRLTIIYQGRCFNQFYFNVYQNTLNPTAQATDILCDTVGSITVNNVPSGYEYSLDGTTYQTNNVFTVTSAGVYTVYVRQTNVPDGVEACVFTVPNVVVRMRDFTLNASATQPQCSGENGNIQVSANDGEPQYTFSIFEDGVLVTTVGPIEDNNYNFQNLGSGTYTANVETGDGCMESTSVTINEISPLIITADLAAPFIDCQIQATDSDGNLLFDEFGNPIYEEIQGQININTTGGTAPYQYFINNSTDSQSSSVFTITSGGDYTIRVVDFNNCEAEIEIPVEEILPPEFTVTAVDIDCATSGDVGRIEFNLTNGYGSSIEYSLDNGQTFSSNSVFANLAPGSYETLVRYTFGSSSCTTLPQTVVIDIPTAMIGEANVTVEFTCVSDAEITVTGVSGGTPGYTFSIDGVNFQTGNVFTGLTAGTYTIIIRDANGCTLPLDENIIEDLNPPTNLDFSSTVTTCPSNTSDVTIATSGGERPLEYRIIAPASQATAYQNSNVFTSLTPNTYTFEVRDANECTYSEDYRIDPLPTINVIAQSLNNVTCFGASDGSIRVTVDGTTNFTYSINGGTPTIGTSPFTLTNLAAGTYIINVRDIDTNCEASDTIAITESNTALALSASETVITCVNDGSVELTATGGWGSYEYTLTQPDGSVLGPQSSTTFASLSLSGTYTALVRDANGCEVTTTFALSTPETVVATISNTSDVCYDPTNGATLVVNTSAGQAPFEFNINGGPFLTNNSFTNLTPGSYTIIVRDAYGCEQTLATQVIEQQLTLTTELTKELDCTSTPDAEITGTISGGYAPFTYAVSVNGAGYTSLGSVTSPFTYTATTSGTYQFQVTDAQGCITQSGVTTISALTSPTATSTSIDPLCFNGTDGEVQLSGSGGVGEYLFSLNGGAFATQSLFSNLSAGTYTYQVQDSNECISPEYTITLANPTEVEASASFPTNTTCSATTVITVTATGGTGSYAYSFEGGSYAASNTYTVNNTTVTQTITYSVRDTNGCIDNETIDIPPYNPVTGMNFTDSNAITCDDTTTDVTITPTGGVSPFTFVITAPGAATTNTTGVNSGIFTGLTDGNYTFEVTDANGCSATASHNILPVRPIQVAFAKADEQCFNANDGEATFTITDVSSTGNYTYTISPAVTTATQVDNEVTVTGLTSGTYTIDVIDSATGCTDSATVTIEAATEITFTAIASNVNCNETSSTITFTAGPSGGTPGYTYVYTAQGATDPAVSSYNNTSTVDTSVIGTNITVWVKDANDCTVSQDINIVTDPTPGVTLAVDNQCNASGSNFTITATGNSGVPPYAYSIDGTNFQSSATFTVSPGTYTLTVRDANGCTAVSNAVIVSPQLTLSAILDKDITCSLPQEGQITLTVNGGNGSYTYEFSTDGGTSYSSMGNNVLNTLTPGSYTFRVTDANGCIAVTTTPIELSTPTDPNISVVQTAFINCNGEETAAISITPDTSVGQAPYVYEVINTTTGTNYGTLTSGLSAGDYTVSVTDAKGCTEVENITISQPDPIVVNNTTVPITCDSSGVSQGSIIIDSVNGGTAPYNYYVNGTNGYDEEELNNAGTTSTTFDVVDFGLYQINVVDSNGCSVLIQDVLVASPPDDLDININSTADCSSGGEAEVTVSTTLASSGPFYFDIYDGTIPPPPPGGTWQLETSPGSITFTGLTTGVTYTFIVYDDSTGCTYFETATAPIPTNSTLTTTAESSNNITCTGSADGNVSFTVNNPEASDININYEIFNAQSLATTTISGTGTVPAGSSLNVTDLGPLGFGNYYVLITETTGPNTGCSIVTAPFNITESANLLNVTASVSQNENCNELGVITAVASDGTAPYQYQILLDTAPAPVATNTGWASANTFNVPEGNYTVYVLDAYGCIQDDDVSLSRDPEPTINTPAAQCFTGNPITITITGTVTIGSPLYSINGTAYSSNPNFEIATSGTYTLYIQDGNGCIATTSYVVNPQITLSAALTKSLDCTASPNAEITLTASGGDSVYTYEVSSDGGATYTTMGSNVYSASTAGTYDFRVTDGAGCQESTTYVLDPIDPIVFTTTETDVSCNGGNNGTITVNVTGGVGPFQYQLDSGSLQNSNVFTGLSQGTTYVITVTDSYSCTLDSAQITIDEPTVLTATASASANTTCDVETIITVVGSGGTPTGVATGYYYSFEGNGFSTTNTYTVNDNETVQTINYIVRDLSNCEVTGSIDVQPLDPPTDLDFSATSVTCTVLTSEVTLTVTGGDAPLSFEILSPAAATSNTSGMTSGVFTGLTPDDYIFQVTDASGCTYQELYTVQEVENIAVVGELISDVTCNPGNNGEVIFTISNFTGSYSYSINGGATVTGQTNPTVSVTGLTGPSTQTIFITDEITGCPITTSIDVSQSAPLDLMLDTNVNATCNVGAQVSVTASGGTPPYAYSFVVAGQPAGTYSSSNTAVLDPGTSTSWDVYVQDGNGCVITTPLNITIDTDPIPSGLTITGLSQCPSATNDYTFTVNVGSGVAPYEYSIGNGFQTSPTFTVNASGTYTVTVRDDNGCSNTIPVTILPALEATAAISNLPSCSDDDGGISVTASGGSGNYEFSINPDPQGVSPSTNPVLVGLPADVYDVTTTDITTGCTSVRQITLGAPTPVTFTTSHEDVSCIGGSDGTITVTLGAGNDNPLYTYAIIAPAGFTRPAQSSNIFDGLSSNTYTVQVTSGRGCTLTEDVVIDEPILLTASATATPFDCAANNSVNASTITITGTDGTPPYVYSIDGNNYFTSNTFEIADTGVDQTFTAYVRDNNNCEATDTVNINTLNAITAAAFAITSPIDCNNTGQVTINVTGGSTNFEYQLLPNGTPQGSNVFTLTDPGSYYFQVNDLTTGCYFLTGGFDIEPFDTIAARLEPVQDIDCFGNNNGQLELTVSDYTGTYNYQVLDSSGSPVGTVQSGNTTSNPQLITGMTAGSYTVSVSARETPFCTTVSNSVTIATPNDAVNVVASETNSVTCENNIGTITAIGSGGVPPYEYQLSGPISVSYSSVSTFENLTAGSYSVTIRDANECVATDTILLEEPDAITANFPISPIEVACFGDQTASITVTNVQGGQGADYNYTLNRLSPTVSTFGPQTSNVFDNLGAGTYSVTIQDTYNCILTSEEIVIDEPDLIKVSYITSSTQTCLSDTRVTIAATGGTGIYTYDDTSDFSSPLGTFVSDITLPLSPGTYEFFVKDENDCVSNASIQITIEPLVELDLTLSSENPFIICSGETTGSITAVATGGLGNYVYTLQNEFGVPLTATQNSPGVFTELAADTYQVYVESGDCQYTSETLTITQPEEALYAEAIETNISCFGSNDGVIEIVVTGGVPPYSYYKTPTLQQTFETNIFYDLEPDDYTLYVQDSAGCNFQVEATITEPEALIPVVDNATIFGESCLEAQDGSFSIDIIGGTPPFTVTINDLEAITTFDYNVVPVSVDFSNLSGGDKEVTVTDANGCAIVDLPIEFPETLNFTAVADVEYNCDDNSPGNTVTVTVSPNISDFNPESLRYSLNGGPEMVSNIFTNVSPGENQVISVSYIENGCEPVDTNLFTIDDIQILSLSLSEGNLNEIIATTTGGYGDYQYTFNGISTGSSNSYIISESGTYIVTVTDREGCTVTDQRYFEFIDLCIPTIFTPNDDGVADTWSPGCAINYPDIYTKIFDRYGRVVKVLRQGDSWDGRYDSKELPTGDYWYIVTLGAAGNDREFVGHFTLYR